MQATGWGTRCIGEVIGHRWKLLYVLGEGGMASVFAAEDLLERRLVALKIMSPVLRTDERFQARFVREASIASSLSHPNIVETETWGFDPRWGGFLVMEFLVGRTLSERLMEPETLSLEATREIAMQILAGLRTAHMAGVVHRDLKPQNIFLTVEPDRTERVKILDFGIAKFFNGEHASAFSTLGMCMGTARYMPPEQADPRAQVDHRADLYGVGMLIYRCLAGRPPYSEVPTREVFSALIERAPLPLEFHRDDLPEEVYQFVRNATARDPGERFLSAREMESAMRGWPMKLGSAFRSRESGIMLRSEMDEPTAIDDTEVASAAG